MELSFVSNVRRTLSFEKIGLNGLRGQGPESEMLFPNSGRLIGSKSETARKWGAAFRILQ